MARVTSIDKANVLASSILWREVVTEVAKSLPDVALNHMYIDNATMQLIIRSVPSSTCCSAPTCSVTSLSDECAMITGSMGLLLRQPPNDPGFRPVSSRPVAGPGYRRQGGSRIPSPRSSPPP